jgi:hypothetical protein
VREERICSLKLALITTGCSKTASRLYHQNDESKLVGVDGNESATPAASKDDGSSKQAGETNP